MISFSSDPGNLSFDALVTIYEVSYLETTVEIFRMGGDQLDLVPSGSKIHIVICLN